MALINMQSNKVETTNQRCLASSFATKEGSVTTKEVSEKSGNTPSNSPQTDTHATMDCDVPTLVSLHDVSTSGDAFESTATTCACNGNDEPMVNGDGNGKEVPSASTSKSHSDSQERQHDQHDLQEHVQPLSRGPPLLSRTPQLVAQSTTMHDSSPRNHHEEGRLKTTGLPLEKTALSSSKTDEMGLQSTSSSLSLSSSTPSLVRRSQLDPQTDVILESSTHADGVNDDNLVIEQESVVYSDVLQDQVVTFGQSRASQRRALALQVLDQLLNARCRFFSPRRSLTVGASQDKDHDNDPLLEQVIDRSRLQKIVLHSLRIRLGSSLLSTTSPAVSTDLQVNDVNTTNTDIANDGSSSIATTSTTRKRTTVSTKRQPAKQPRKRAPTSNKNQKKKAATRSPKGTKRSGNKPGTGAAVAAGGTEPPLSKRPRLDTSCSSNASSESFSSSDSIPARRSDGFGGEQITDQGPRMEIATLPFQATAQGQHSIMNHSASDSSSCNHSDAVSTMTQDNHSSCDGDSNAISEEEKDLQDQINESYELADLLHAALPVTAAPEGVDADDMVTSWLDSTANVNIESTVPKGPPTFQSSTSLMMPFMSASVVGQNRVFGAPQQLTPATRREASQSDPEMTKLVSSTTQTMMNMNMYDWIPEEVNKSARPTWAAPTPSPPSPPTPPPPPLRRADAAATDFTRRMDPNAHCFGYPPFHGDGRFLHHQQQRYQQQQQQYSSCCHGGGMAAALSCASHHDNECGRCTQRFLLEQLQEMQQRIKVLETENATLKRRLDGYDQRDESLETSSAPA